MEIIMKTLNGLPMYLRLCLLWDVEKKTRFLIRPQLLLVKEG